MDCLDICEEIIDDDNNDDYDEMEITVYHVGFILYSWRRYRAISK